MIFFRRAKELLVTADLFHSSQLLRYKSDTEYKTLTGGIISLCTMIAVIVGFFSMIRNTLQKDKISSKLQIVKTGDPPLMQLKGGQDNFMFGLFVQTLDVSTTFDLLNGPQFFDIVMREVVIKYGTYPEYTPKSLEKCTPEHWKMEPSVLKNFDNYKVQNWLCPKLNEKFTLSGIYGSDYFSFIQFSLYPCKNDSSTGNRCAPQNQIDKLFEDNQNFYLTLSYINAVLNPNQVKYISNYYETQNYLIFSKNIGAQTWVYLSDYTIQSDNSILPYQDITIQKGYIGETIGSKIPFSVSKDGRLASVNFAKSRNSLKYDRQVLKIFEVVSYMGGLVSAVVGLLFIFKAYTDTAFEMNIGSDLFYLPPQNQSLQDKSGKQTKSQHEHKKKPQRQKFSFNIKAFVYIYLYKILKFFNKGESFVECKKMAQYKQQITNQLDVKLLLYRVLKLQLFISQFSNEQKIRVIKNYKQLTLEKAKQLRNIFIYQDEFESNKKFIQNGIQNIHQDAFSLSSQSPHNTMIQKLTIHKRLENQIHQDVFCQNFEEKQHSNNFLVINYPMKSNNQTIKKMASDKMEDRKLAKQLKIQAKDEIIDVSAKDVIIFDRQQHNKTIKQKTVGYNVEQQ